MEAIWVAAEMRAGGAYAHSTIALHALREDEPTHLPEPGVSGVRRAPK